MFAALGSWLSWRWQGAGGNGRWVHRAVSIMAATALLYLAILPPLFQVLMHLPDAAKIVISVALIAPLALCMGIPFPTGMTQLARTAQDSIPWAWAINGFASVVGAVLATLLAIHLGFAVVILSAILIYGLACVALRGYS
jgi:hypothetical protein